MDGVAVTLGHQNRKFEHELTSYFPISFTLIYMEQRDEEAWYNKNVLLFKDV